MIASMWSPATSETVRLISRAGAAAAARRPPLKAETCLRTVFTSTMLIPEESSSSCRSRFSAAETPSGGRLASEELPPVKQAITMSRSPALSAIESSRRAAAIERPVGSG